MAETTTSTSRAIDRRLQGGQFGSVVADSRKHFADVGICLEYLVDSGSCRRSGIDHIDSCRDGRQIAGPMGHTTVGYGRPILDDQDTLPLTAALSSSWIGDAARTTTALELTARRPCSARSTSEKGAESVLLMTRTSAMRATAAPGWCRRDLMQPQRVGDRDMQVRLHEGEIIVAAVPDDDLGLRPPPSAELGIVRAGKNHVADSDMGFVLLSLFRCALRCSKSAIDANRCARSFARSP